MELPGDLVAAIADYEGVVRFSRRFHRPTGLTDSSRVELVIVGLPESAQIDLNGQVVPAAAGECRIDATGLLVADMNQLMVEFPIVGGQSMAADVTLEIWES